MLLNNQNSDHEFNLPAIIGQESLQAVASQMESSFVLDQEDLVLALEKLGLNNVTHLMETAHAFLIKKLQGPKLTLTKVQNLNHKRVAYEFLRESGIQKPVFESPEQKKMVIEIYFKLGRVYIHNILLQELYEINPNLAHSVLSWLRRVVGEICVDEGVSPSSIADKLLLNEMYLPAPPLIPNQSLPGAVKTGTSLYIVKDLISVQEIHDVAQKVENLRVIFNKEEFIQLVHSEGAPFQLLNVRDGNVQFIAYLFLRMFSPYDVNHPPLLKLSKGQGYWPFLQQNLQIGKNTCPDRIRKIASETSKSPQCIHIVGQVDSILKPIYKTHYKDSPHL